MPFLGYFNPNHCSIDSFNPLLVKDLSDQNNTVISGDNWAIAGSNVLFQDNLAIALDGFCLNLDQQDQLQQIAELYRKHKTNLPNELNGPFAIAIIDSAQNSLLLIRDHIGQKEHFHATLTSKTVVFSTHLNPLKKFPRISTQLNIKALADFTSLGYVPPPNTFYTGIKRLKPASTLLVDERQTCESNFWMPTFKPYRKINFHDAVEETWKRLDIAINRCLQCKPHADSLLSGGIDSNLITAIASTSPAFGGNAFTAGFQNPLYDERTLAKIASDKYRINNFVTEVVPTHCTLLTPILSAYGEPFADASIIPTTVAMLLAKYNGATAILSGTGGDEIFAGYRRYQAMALRQKWNFLPKWLVNAVATAIIALCGNKPHDTRSRLATLTRMANFWKQPPIQGFATFQEIFNHDLKQQLLTFATNSYLEQWQKLVEHLEKPTFLEQANAIDIATYLPEDGCRKEAIAANFVSITSLNPMLDRELVEFALQLPPSFRLTTRSRKRVLTQIAEYIIPPELIQQPKRGFGMPLADWFSDESTQLLYQLEDKPQLWDKHGYFNHAVIQKLIHEHREGIKNNAYQLWLILTLAKA